jgi:hypothetical protein
VNFSGRATDAQGKAIAGVAGITFAIYKDQYEGASLWMETQNVQADARGNYTVQLGATRSDGLPLELFTASDARWLGVTVNGGQEQPRVLLLSVPYALKAPTLKPSAVCRPRPSSGLTGRKALERSPKRAPRPRLQLLQSIPRSPAKAWWITSPCGTRAATSSIP